MASNNTPYLQQPHLHTKAEHRAAVLTYPGNFREALKQAQADPKKTLFGVAHGIASVAVTKVLASAKPDFIWIDYEHAVFDRSSLYDAIHAAQHHSEGKTLVVVRVPKGDAVGLATALDAGASAIVMPHTETAEEVREMIKETFYPPLGQRSFSPWTFTPGISNQSIYEGDEWNMKNSNNHVCLIPQIESVKGLKNIDEIASVEGISGLMFGPGDYSADAGINFSMSAPPPQNFLDAMGAFFAGAKRHNLPVFGGAQSPAMIPMMIQQGCCAIAVVFDYWGVAQMVHDGVKAARAMVEGPAEGEKASNGTVPVTAESNGATETNGSS